MRDGLCLLMPVCPMDLNRTRTREQARHPAQTVTAQLPGIHLEPTAVDSLVLTYNQLLGAVSDFYEALLPAPEDRGCLLALHMVTAMPMPESQVLHKLAQELDEQNAVTALALAKSYRGRSKIKPAILCYTPGTLMLEGYPWN